MERWRRPAKILEIGETALVYDAPDGRTWAVPEIVTDADTKERIRLGYMCALCFEPFEHAWPEECSFCRARVREGQGEFFTHIDGGEIDLNDFDLDTEIEYMREQLRRQGR